MLKISEGWYKLVSSRFKRNGRKEFSSQPLWVPDLEKLMIYENYCCLIFRKSTVAMFSDKCNARNMWIILFNENHAETRDKCELSLSIKYVWYLGLNKP